MAGCSGWAWLRSAGAGPQRACRGRLLQSAPAGSRAAQPDPHSLDVGPGRKTFARVQDSSGRLPALKAGELENQEELWRCRADRGTGPGVLRSERRRRRPPWHDRSGSGGSRAESPYIQGLVGSSGAVRCEGSLVRR
jgi:hypothetical protein